MTLSQDLRSALRFLVRAPGATVGMLLSLTLGIGACATVFSWINGILLNPFPGVARSGEFVVLAGRSGNGALSPLSFPDFVDYREGVPGLEDLFAAGAFLNVLALGTPGSALEPERVHANLVSGNYFDALGVRAAAGRVLRPGEGAVPGRDNVAVISHALWQRRFGGDPQVVGRALRLNGRPFVVVGVADARFIGTVVGLSTDLWIPLAMQESLIAGSPPLEDRGHRWIVGMGRPPVALDRAASNVRVQTVAQRLAREHPASNEARGAVIIPISSSPWGAQGGMRRALILFAAMAGLVLLLACANAANLLFVRAAARRREVAVRIALGASRLRIIRQHLIESLAVCVLAAAGGIAAAYLCSDLILAFVPPTDSPFDLRTGVDLAVVAFTLATALAVVGLFGLAPALQASRPGAVDALRDDTRSTTGRRAARLRTVLVGVQVALATALLVGATLFGRSVAEAARQSPGFNPDGVVLTRYDLSQLGLTAEQGGLFHQELLQRIERLPGVTAATAAARVPLGFTGIPSLEVSIEGHVRSRLDDGTVTVNYVGPNYLRTLQIPLRHGRDLWPQDTVRSEAVAIINEAMARRYWKDAGAAVGSRLRVGDRHLLVVGVAATSRYRALNEDPLPHMYLPLAQNHQPAVTLHVRTAADAGAALSSMRAVIAEMNPNLPLFKTETLRAHMGFGTFVQRLSTSLLGVFGALALVLAVIGVYSLTAFSVLERAPEFAVRSALGASPRAIVSLVVRSGLRQAMAGLLAGLALSAVLWRSARSFFIGVDPFDPVSFAAVAALLLAATLAASVFPASRASRVEITRLLRH